MEINSLRSQLQHACPDLRNLTNAELEEGKWPTKKNVFFNLIAGSRSLQDEHEDLTDLNEERNVESALMKKESAPREVRIESETIYRTKFMRIVLSALHRLKWPPSLEAFSDPLDSLFNDASAFRNAAEYILKVSISSNIQVYHENEVSTSTPPKLPPRPKSGVRSEPLPSHHGAADSVTAPEISNLDILFGVNKSRALVSSIPENESMVSSFGYEQANFTPRTPFQGSGLDDSHIVLGQSSKDKKHDLNWKAFEMLQRQNELLSVRLRELQLSVLKRDESEGKIAGILSELKSTIAEIADAGHTGGSKKAAAKAAAGFEGGSIMRGGDGATRPGGGGGGVLSKEQEMEAFRLEVEHEMEENLKLKDKSLGITQISSSVDVKPTKNSLSGVKGKPPVARAPSEPDRKASLPNTAFPARELCAKCRASVVDGNETSVSTGVIWSKLHSKLSSLESQWTNAQRSARSLAGDLGGGCKQSPGKAGSPPPRFAKNSVGSVPGVLYSAQSTPSRSVVSKAFGVQPALMSGGVHSSFGGGGFDGDVFSSPPQPPASRQSQYSQHSAAVPDSSCHQGGLDLARVHLLQRDLIAFAERAFAWSSTSLFVAPPPQEENSGVSAAFGRASVRSTPVRGSTALQHPTAVPTSDLLARRQQEAHELQLASWDLLLHLSGVAPIVPLALNSPLRSTMTGLEALIQETVELAYPKISKQSQLRLQVAADRALAEQVATIRCWRQARSCLTQWAAHATRVAPTLKMLGKRHKSNVSKCEEDLVDISAGLGGISEALEVAEGARLRPSADESSLSGTSHRAAAAVSPLDSLARGSAGKEVAALVLALRAHRGDLGEAAQSVRSLGAKLAAELKRDLDVVGSMENNLLFAADLTENILETGLLLDESASVATFVPASLPSGARKPVGSRPKRSEGGSAKAVTPPRPAFDLSLS